MLFLDDHVSCWDERLKPIGESSLAKETFEEWWGRNASALQNLNSKITEQWVYKHWTHSPYCFIRLETLSWKLETWQTQTILTKVHIRGWNLDPDYDYRTFKTLKLVADHATATAIDQSGTWDYPIVVLNTPDGFRDRNHSWPGGRYLLVEGHSRLRYLNAKHDRLRWTDCGDSAFNYYSELR